MSGFWSGLRRRTVSECPPIRVCRGQSGREGETETEETETGDAETEKRVGEEAVGVGGGREGGVGEREMYDLDL